MKIKHTILIVLASVGVSSCEFLERTPITSLSGENVYDTESSLETCMNGVYSGLSAFGSTYVTHYLPIASQLVIFRGTRTSVDYNQLKYMTFYSETGSAKGLYSGLYSGVGNCNDVLEGLKSSSVGTGYLREIEAEVKFLRAYFYFALVRLYGNVPLITEKVTDETQVNVVRTPYQEVYARILDDLDFAEKYMRTKERQEEVNPKRNRVFRGAATALKAQVYSQIACYMESPYDQFFDVTRQGRYPDFSGCGLKTSREAWKACLDCCDSLMRSRVYGLEPDYRNLFAWNPDENAAVYSSKERIFALANSPSTAMSNAACWCNWDNPAGTEAVEEALTSSNFGRTRVSFFMWERWCKAHGGTAVTDAEGVTYYPDCPDPRFSASYAYKDIPKHTTLGGDTYFNTYPVSTHSEFTGSNAPYFWKYISSTFKADAGDADLYLIRYADICLLAAEAAASLSSGKGDANWEKALQYANMVLSRARNSVNEGSAPAEYPKDFTDADFSDRQALVDAIVWEQLFETNGEFHEWFITHKRGATWLKRHIVDPCYEYYSRPECVKVVSQAFRGDISCFLMDVQEVRKSLLIAFPAEELRRNTVLSESEDQNDFYIR